MKPSLFESHIPARRWGLHGATLDGVVCSVGRWIPKTSTLEVRPRGSAVLFSGNWFPRH